MKVSLNWLKQYLDISLSAEAIGDLLTDIGLELEGMETVESIPGGLRGIVIGEVKDHRPLAVKNKTLSFNMVDVGQPELLSIVCGASNVAAGQKVLVAMVGTTVNPPTGTFTIERRKVYGEWSEGMICSEDEIGLGEDHSGIVVLPADAPVGKPAAEYYAIESDVVFEIGLTPNRSDATNQLGVARDLAARLRIAHGHSGELRLPDVSGFQVDSHELPVEVELRNPEAAPRYSGVTINNVKVGESPEWLKTRLRAVGVRPINNIVDITNFVLHELGQPLHAFDLEKIKGRRVLVQTLPAGAKFLSLDERERTLHAEDLMICDGDSNPMCIGGVFGGLYSGVSEQTRQIFLESAHFHPKWIRRSSMRHDLRTDAAKVFEKGSDPNITVYALKRAALMIRELAGGEIASEIIDLYPKPIEPARVELRLDKVNTLLGVELSRPLVRSILEALDMGILEESDSRFTVAVPTNKADVTREVDLIEEILRVYGFNSIPIPEKVNTTMAISRHPDPELLRNTIADLLCAQGFHQMMALSLSQSRYYKEYLPVLPDEALVYINNTANVHLDIMRPDMLFSGLEAVLHNQNRQRTNIKLFEFGRSYRRLSGDQFDERNHLSLFLAGERRPETWLHNSGQQSDYYTLRAFVHQILQRLGIGQLDQTPLRDEVFTYGLRYQIDGEILVEFGKISPSLIRRMDIRSDVFYADLRWDALLKATGQQHSSFRELSRYPTVRRDLALVIENSIKFGDIVAIAQEVGKPLIKEINLFDVYENETQLGQGKKSYAVSFLFEDSNKTLQDKEVDAVVGQLIRKYEEALGAKIRK